MPRHCRAIAASCCWLLLAHPATAAPAQTSRPQRETKIPTADDRLFERAMQAVDAGDVIHAEPLLEQLHGRHPENYALNESLGEVYAAQGRLQDAVRLLKAAARQQPDSDVTLANLGTVYLKLGRPDDAVRELQHAARLNPANAGTEEALGEAWMALKQPRSAAQAFTQALSLSGSDPDLLYNAALALFECGQAAEAEPLLARMPGMEASAQAQSLYGDVEEALGHYEQAGRHYAEAARIAPTEANVYMLGIEFLRHWTFDAAAKEFAAGVQQFPGSRRMRFGLAVAYYGAGNYDKAIPALADLLAEDPSETLYAELLGHTCAFLAEGLNPRCSELVTYVRQHPADAGLLTSAATMLLHRPRDSGDWQTAQQLLEKALQIDPRSAEAQYGMGLLLQSESQWPQSIPYLEAAVRLKPEYASAHYRLALAYSHVGQRDKAKAEIALHQRYAKQEAADLDTRLKQVTTFLVTMK